MSFCPTPGTSGPGGIWPVTPINGVSDDWPRLMGTIAPIAVALGLAIQLCPGPNGEKFQCLSSVPTPSNLVIYGTPATVITGNIAGTALSSAPFYAGAPVGLAVGTIAAAVIGATTVTFTKTSGVAPVIGDYVELSSPASLAVNDGMTFLVTNVAGVGPYTLTLDHALQRPLAASAIASVTNPPTSGIQIFGNGMVISGAWNHGLAFVSVWNVNIRDIVFNESVAALSGAGPIAALYDTGTYRSSFKNLDITSTTATNAIRLAATESCSADGWVHGSPSTVALSINDGTDIDATIRADGADTLVQLFSDGGDATVAHNYDLRINASGKNLSRGFIESTTCVGLVVPMLNAQNVSTTSGHYGLQVSSSGASFGKVNLSGGEISALLSGTGNNYESIIATGYGADGVEFGSASQSHAGFIDVSSNSGAVVYGVNVIATAVVDIDHVQYVGHLTNTGALPVLSSGTTHIKDAYLRVLAGGSSNPGGALRVSGGITTIDGGTCSDESGNTWAFVVINSGVLITRNVINTGGYFVTMGVGTFRDYGSRTSGNYSIGSGFFVRGTVTLNGTTGVAVSWPDLTSADRVTLTPKTPSGSFVTPPKIAYTPGTGFTVTGATVGDTTTVMEWEVI